MAVFAKQLTSELSAKQEELHSQSYNHTRVTIYPNLLVCARVVQAVALLQ